MLRKALPILALALLTGCAVQKDVAIPVIQLQPQAAIPTAEPLVLNPVNWKVMTAADIKTYAADPSSAKNPLFSLDDTDFTNLSLNLVEIKRYLDEQKAIIKMLKTLLNERSQGSTSGGSQTTTSAAPQAPTPSSP